MKLLKILLLICCSLVMLGTGICSGVFLVMSIWNRDNDNSMLLVVVGVGGLFALVSGSIAWALIRSLRGATK